MKDYTFSSNVKKECIILQNAQHSGKLVKVPRKVNGSVSAYFCDNHTALNFICAYKASTMGQKTYPFLTCGWVYFTLTFLPWEAAFAIRVHIKEKR